MTLTFGIATRARLGTVARRPTGAIGATRETSTTTWATTPRAGTPRDSAARKRASVTAPKPTCPAPPARGGVGTAVRPDHGRAPRGRRDGSHARAWAQDPTESTQLNWDNEATGSMLAPELPARGRRGSHGGGPVAPAATGLGGPGLGAPAGPGGPRRPRGPRGLAGPGRRGLDRPRGQGQGQLVAALDAAQGPGRPARRRRRHRRARRGRGGHRLREDAGSHRGPGGHRLLAVRGLLQGRQPHRPVRHHQPEDAAVRRDPAGR